MRMRMGTEMRMAVKMGTGMRMGMRMGTGHCPAAGAGCLWLTEGGFWSAPTSFPGPPVRRGHIQVPGDGSGDPITWAGWAAAHGQCVGLRAGVGARPLLTAHLSKLGKQGSASPALAGIQ